jgi:hypothetical protein
MEAFSHTLSFHFIFVFIPIKESCFLYKYPYAPKQTKTFDNQNTLPLFSCVLTKPERDLCPFALVFSFMEITEVAASLAPNPCSESIDSRSCRLVSLKVWLDESLV